MMTLPFASRSQHATIPAVSLRRLLPDAEFRGCPDLVVSGLCADVHHLEPGQVFIAIESPGEDASEVAAQAIERGASGIVLQHPLDGAGPIQVVVSDTRSAYAAIAQALAGQPSRWLPVVGVTGLGGKTAASLFLRAIFEADGRRIDTITPAHLTEQRCRDASPIAAALNVALERRCDLALLNLSAGSLSDRVADGLIVDSALICPGRAPIIAAGNDRRAAIRAMARLTRAVRPDGVIAIEAGEPELGLLAATNLSARVVTYGVGDLGEVTAAVEERDLDGTRFRLRGLDRERIVQLRPIGEPALLAALGAAAIARDYGASDGAIVAGLESVSRIPARLEPVATSPRHHVFADRAASGRSVRAAARTLRERVSGEIISVLAVTADTARAAEIVAAVESEGLRVILTRAEPESVVIDLEAILARFRQPGRVRVCLDRDKALVVALEMCGPEDAVALFGPSADEWRADGELIRSWMGRERSQDRRSA